MNKETKLSLLSDMIALAKSSGSIKDIEYSFLLAVAEQLGISETELQLLAKSRTDHIVMQSEAERILHFHRLVLLMNVDKKTEGDELFIVKNFGLQMGLSQEAVNKVIEIMGDYPNKVVPPDVLISIFKTQHN